MKAELQPQRHEDLKKRKSRTARSFFIVSSCLCGLSPIVGCSSAKPGTSATAIDPMLATMDYWLTMPATEKIAGRDFYPLWDACAAEVHSRFFELDRQDYRGGVMSTIPMVSKQEFEVWRRDAVTVKDVTESSLATIRRSVWFQVQKQPDGTFTAEPKVLVERAASAEHRLSAIYEYHSAFAGLRVVGSTEADEGIKIPTDYWYAIGRDTALEKDIATAIQSRLRS